MSNNNAKFAAIRAAIGSTLDAGGPQAYFQRLVKQAGPDVDAFLAWSRQQPIPAPPQITPQAFLQLLQNTKFADDAALITLGDAIDSITGGAIVLAANESRRLVVTPTTADLTVDPYFQTSGGGSAVGIPGADTHPCIVKLEPVAPGPAVPLLPKYVFSVGRLAWQDIRPASAVPAGDPSLVDEDDDAIADPEKRRMRPTNYAVVVDVASRDRAVWAVYNRRPYDAEEGDYVDADPAADRAPVFNPGVPLPSPDAAQVLTALSGWTAPTPARFDAVLTRVGQTAWRGRMVAKSATATEVEQALSAISAPEAPKQ